MHFAVLPKTLRLHRPTRARPAPLPGFATHRETVSGRMSYPRKHFWGWRALVVNELLCARGRERWGRFGADSGPMPAVSSRTRHDSRNPVATPRCKGSHERSFDAP